jgi:WD40 repeat protein
MLTVIRTLLLAAGISGALALFAPPVQAITIRSAEVQGDYAVVNGRKAEAYQTITWEGVAVATANRRGHFSFSDGVVPEDCTGTLSDGVTTIEVALDNCPPDSGGGGGEPAPELALQAAHTSAHDGDAVRAVGFAAAAGGGPRVVSGGEDARLRSWNLSLEEAGVQSLDHTVYDLEVSPDGALVVTGEGGWNGGTDTDTLRISDADGLRYGTRAPIGYVYCVAISPDTHWTVASGFYGDIVVYATTDLQLYANRATKKKRTKALAFSPDGSLLASTSTAGRILLWSFPGDCSPAACELERLPVTLSHSGSWTFPVAFDPGSDQTLTRIVSGTDGGMIKRWRIEHVDAASPDVSFTAVDTGAVYSLDWSPDGSRIVAGGSGDITVYDADTLEVLFRNGDAHTSRVNDVAFSPDGSLIVSGGADGALKLWSLAVD